MVGKYHGKNVAIIPGEGAKEEDWSPVYDAIGRPKTPDDYKMPELKLKDELKDKVSLDEADLKEFRAYAHSRGITQRQFEDILKYRMDKQIKEYEGSLQQAEASRVEGETKLRAEWGAKYDENMAMIQKTLKAFGKDLDLPDDPKQYDQRLVRLFSKMAASFSEATLGDLGAGGGGGGNMTPDEAKAKIAEIRGNDKHPFNLDNHPDHAQAVVDMSKLYEQAHPGKRKI